MNNISLNFNRVMIYDIDKKKIIKQDSGFAFIPNINDSVKFDEDIFTVVKKVFDFNDNYICLFVTEDNILKT
jgi:hypothetical protein